MGSMCSPFNFSLSPTSLQINEIQNLALEYIAIGQTSTSVLYILVCSKYAVCSASSVQGQHCGACSSGSALETSHLCNGS